jgi:hypothetical protein
MNIPFLSRFGTLAQGSRTYGARALIDIRDEFAWHANILHEPLYVYMKAKVMESQEQQRNIHKIISESKTYICYSVTSKSQLQLPDPPLAEQLHTSTNCGLAKLQQIFVLARSGTQP